MATLNELVTALSFKVDSKSFQNLAQITAGVSMLQENFETLGKIAGRGQSFMDILFGTAKKGQDLYKTAQTLGMSAVSIQKWEYAMKRVGGSSEEAVSLLSKLKEWGIETDEQMMKLADDLASGTAETRYPWLRYFSKNELSLLSQGAEVLRKEFKDIEPFVLMDDQVKRLNQLQQEIIKMQEIFGSSVKKAMADNFLPYAEKMSAWMEDFLKDADNRKLLLEGLATSLAALGGVGVIKALKAVTNSIKNLVGAFVSLKDLGAFLTTPVGGLILGLISAGVAYETIQNILEKQKDYKDKTAQERLTENEKALQEERAKKDKSVWSIAKGRLRDEGRKFKFGSIEDYVEARTKELLKEKGYDYEYAPEEIIASSAFAARKEIVDALEQAKRDYEEADTVGIEEHLQKEINEDKKRVEEQKKNTAEWNKTYSGGLTTGQYLSNKYLEQAGVQSQDNSQTQYNTINVTVQGDSSKGVVENSESGIKRALQIAHPAKVDSIEPAVNVQ